MYCRECGAKIPDSSKYCIKCGAPQYEAPQYGTQPVSMNDSGSLGWAVLGFFFPIVGLVLYLVWLQERPKSALMAGKGALVSAILGISIYIIAVGFFFSTVSMLP